ncbi:glycosyltransferase family 4 protein [Turicibacter sp. TJ11]|uniref:glycosyltransferase family 4 protein n=1 Tax=Turicibacter sp. TJ11 TaxID=2806443 RepID=UPI001F2CC30D|nr:glycosyltransferase family 4 protein [Turicibacter sp. TJ11]
MNLLNINSYFLSSSVHNTLEKVLMKECSSIKTFVPIQKDYIIRKECDLRYDKHVSIVKCFNKYDRLLFKYKGNKIYRHLINQYRWNEFDIIHAHSLFTNGYHAMKLKEVYKIPYVVTIRDTDINFFFKKIKYLRRLGNEILANADAIVFLSPMYKERLITTYIYDSLKTDIIKKSVVIPNPIDNYWLDNCHTQTNIIGDVIKIIYVGQINKRKNLLKSILAIERLINQGYKIEFSIVGKVGQSDLEKKFLKYSFINRIYQLSKEELIKQYRKNHIFLMPSITESFGLVYAEALSQGIPVIYTKNEGFDGQFENGLVGYCVDCYDEVDISNKIKLAIENYDILVKNTTLSSFKFSSEVISNEFLSIYNSIILD